MTAELVLGVIALLSALASVYTAWAAIRKTRKAAEDDCAERMRRISELVE